MDRTVIKHVCVLRRLGVKSYDTPNGSIITITQMDKARQDAVVFQAETIRSAATGHTLSPHVLEKERKNKSDRHVAQPTARQPAGLS